MSRRTVTRSIGPLLVVLALWGALGCAAAGATPLAPAGQASPEPYEVFLGPPGPNLGSIGPTVVYETGAGREGESGPLEGRDEPLEFDGGLSGSSGLSTRLLLTSNAVAAVSVDGGPPLPTRPAIGPPYELRSALVEIPIAASTIRARQVRVQIALFDAAGQPIVSTVPAPVLQATALETRAWQQPAMPAVGVCRMTATRLPWLIAQLGSVVSVLRPLLGAGGRPMLTCAETTYSYRGDGTFSAYVALDAEHPGRTPEGMTLMTPTAGSPGVFQARLQDGYVVGRRVPGGWLLVEGGQSLSQRLSLLADLHATVRPARKPTRTHDGRQSKR